MMAAPKKTKATKSRRGLFVTFEGIDGCGKSTQLALAQKLVSDMGYSVVALREPGSTPAAEKIRKLLLDPRTQLADLTELLLYCAARAEVVTKEIAPLLASGQVVLCDRFYDSTTAYQGYGRGLDLKVIKRLHRTAVGQYRPDLTLLYDVDLKTSRLRMSRRPDRLESEPTAFFRRVRRGFLEIARQESRRVKLINGGRSVEIVFAETEGYLLRKLRRL